MKALAFDAPDPWRFYLVHGELLLFATGAIVALFVRSRKPACGWDALAWASLKSGDRDTCMSVRRWPIRSMNGSEL